EMLLTEMLTAALEDVGSEVLVASQGKEALELIRERKPDLLVTDFMMPVITRLELAEAIRSDAQSADPPLVLVTGAQGAVARRHSNLFTHVLDKPYNLHTLLEIVASTVAPD